MSQYLREILLNDISNEVICNDRGETVDMHYVIAYVLQ